MKPSSNRNSETTWKKNPKARRVLIGVLLAVFFAGVGFFALAWRASIASITRPDSGSFPVDLVTKGEILSAVGHCAAALALSFSVTGRVYIHRRASREKGGWYEFRNGIDGGTADFGGGQRLDGEPSRATRDEGHVRVAGSIHTKKR